MTKTMEMIYERGLLRPEEPLEVAEQTRLRVTIEIDAAAEHKEQAVGATRATRNPFIGSVQGAEPGAPIAREHDRCREEHENVDLASFLANAHADPMHRRSKEEIDAYLKAERGSWD